MFLIAAAIAACAVAGWLFLRSKAPAPIAWQGYAEANFVKAGPTLQGLVTALHVARGDRVEKEQPLFE